MSLRIAVGWFAALLTLPAVAQVAPCWHLSGEGVKALYSRSAFVHGYMHGYEEGFHVADLDLHMGRGERGLNQIKEYRQAKTGYRSGFGDRGRFKDGFYFGFRNGYADGVSGSEFRALSEARAVADGLPDSVPDKRNLKQFDEGFSAGYNAGWQHGRLEPRPVGDFEPRSPDCRAMAPHRANNQDYCEGFTRGYRMGLVNGHDSQQTQPAMSARTGRP